MINSDDGQVSDFAGSAGYADWYTPSDIRKMGMDFVRLPVNPAPLLENPPAAKARLFNEIDDTVTGYTAAGMFVIVDLHFWSPPNKIWTADQIVPGSSSSAFAAYRMLIRGLATRLADRNGVALELMNEPPNAGCRSDGWIKEQKILISEARSVAPRLRLVISGCGGQVDGLVNLSPGDVDFGDRNLIFSFHFYEPFLFTHQGVYSEYKYVADVPYPALEGSMMATIVATNRIIDQSNLSATDSLVAKTRALSLIKHYFSQPQDKEFIRERMDAVIAWAKSNNVLPDQILLGEFAAINWRENNFPGQLTARQRWDSDVENAARSHGIASAFWNLPYPNGALFR